MRALTSLRIPDLDLANANLHLLEVLSVYITAILAQVSLLIRNGNASQDIINSILLQVSFGYSFCVMLHLDIMDHLFYPLANLEIPPEESRFSPKSYRSIDDFESDFQAERLTRFNIESLKRLMYYWRIPEEFRIEGRRHVFKGEECMIILLNYLAKGRSYVDMTEDTFGGDPRNLTHIVRCIVEHLHQTFYHKISGDSMRMWTHPETIRQFSYAIWSRLRELDEGDEFIDRELFQNFRIFGFVDCLGHETTRVGGEARRVHGYQQDIQRAFYSGYFRAHGLKSLIVYLPNGLIGSAYVASLLQNDRGMQNMAGLNDYLVSLLHNQVTANMDLPAVYGDGIFTPLPTIIPKYNRNMLNQLPDRNYYEAFNTRMSSIRISIEHCFGTIYNLFRVFHHSYMLRVFGNGEHLRKLVLVSYFIMNCYACEYNSTAAMFDLRPPPLQSYIPREEMIPPPPVVPIEQMGNLYVFGR